MANIDLKNGAVLKTVLGVLLAGGMLGVFFFTHFLPFSYTVRKERIDGLKADFEKRSTELARARASVADLPRFEAEYEQLHTRWSAAAELLPTDRQSAALLRKITLAGQQTGIQFVMFKPGGIRDQTYYTEMPVEIVVHGGYHQIGSFMAELANMRRIVTVSNLKLTTAPANEHGATAAVAFSASAYSLNTSPTPAAAPAAAGGAAPPAGGAKKGDGTHAHQES